MPTVAMRTTLTWTALCKHMVMTTLRLAMTSAPIVKWGIIADIHPQEHLEWMS